MISTKRRWQMLLLVLVATFGIFASEGTSFAAIPGEDANWQPEERGDGQGGNGQIYSSDTMSEARNTGGQLMRVWRAQTGDSLWAEFGGTGPLFTIHGATTNVAPRVVEYGNGFAIFHTGTNDVIYMSTTQSTNPNNEDAWSPWVPAGGFTTQQSPSVTQVNGTFSNQLYMTFRGNGNDDRVFGAFWNGSSWSGGPIPDGNSPSAPTVAWDQARHQIVTAIQGLSDSAIYINTQNYGSGTWNGWRSIGGGTVSSPSIAIASNGAELIGIRALNSSLWWYAVAANGSTPGWQPDNTPGWFTYYAPFISNDTDNNFYAIITGTHAGDVWYKHLYFGNGPAS